MRNETVLKAPPEDRKLDGPMGDLATTSIEKQAWGVQRVWLTHQKRPEQYRLVGVAKSAVSRGSQLPGIRGRRRLPKTRRHPFNSGVKFPFAEKLPEVGFLVGKIFWPSQVSSPEKWQKGVVAIRE